MSLKGEERQQLDIDCFFSSYRCLDSGCWQWTKTYHYKGYGIFYCDGREYRAHRYSYELLVGSIPEGMVLDHLCRNRGCVNPKHLEPVTHATNVKRGNTGKHNKDKTHCIWGP